MSKCVRSVVALVAGIALLAGLAGPVVGQSVVTTWPMTTDVSGLDRVAVFLQNISPVNVEGVIASLFGPSLSSVKLAWIDVFRVGSNGIGVSCFRNNPSHAASISTKDCGQGIRPGESFVVLVQFTGQAVDGARLVIAPAFCYNPWYGTANDLYPIAVSGGQ
jgi:hypothetical protein